MFRTMSRNQVILDVIVALLAAGIAVLLYPGDFIVASVVGATSALTLTLRRLAPGAALTIAWLGAVWQMAAMSSIVIADLLIPAVMYTSSLYGTNRTRRAGLISVFAGAIVGSVFLTARTHADVYLAGVRGTYTGSAQPWLELFATMVVILALLLLPWLLGLVIRTRSAAKMSREAQLLAERDAARADRAVAVEQERVRIAREMHDIVAHSLGVVIAQADGARYALRASPETADAALTTIAGTARRALGDVRELLGVLRHEQGAAPTPEVDDIDRLVADMRGIGLEVEIERARGLDTLPTTTQLAVYRIVQESLTNAYKHGEPGTPTMVRVGADAGGITIRVTNRRRTDGRRGAGTGHGIVGMRERATMAGGTMTAGPRGSDFAVVVRIPAGGTGPVARLSAAASKDQATKPAITSPGTDTTQKRPGI